MNLRHDLADRLAQCVVGADMMERESFESLADECIRQMEWASKEAADRLITEPIDCSGYPGMSGIRVLGMKPLTPAPPEWKP